MKQLITILTILLGIASYGSDTSTGNGNWESDTVWTKGVEPTTEDTLVILIGDTLEITSNYTYPNDVVIIVRGAISFSGKLNLSENSELFVDGGSLITTGGGNSDKLKIGGVGVWSGDQGNLIVSSAFPEGASLPVLWGPIVVTTQQNNISVNWSTFTETNNFGFNIEFSEDLVQWSVMGFVPGNRNSDNINKYTYNFLSDTLEIVYIRLVQIDYDGDTYYSDITSTSTKKDNIIWYVNTVGKKFKFPPTQGIFIIIYSSGNHSRIFIK
jgi:hypothetical protein